MQEVAKLLKSLESATCSDLAKSLSRRPQEVLIDLKFMQRSNWADCINGIWRLRVPFEVTKAGIESQTTIVK